MSFKNYISSVFMFLSLTGLFSCDMNKIDYDEDDSESAQNESVSGAYFDDASEMTTATIKSADTTASVKIQDNRFSCATITYERSAGSTFLRPKGVFTVDFGVGCADGRGNVRSGKIRIARLGRRFLPGSSLTTTFEDYRINGVLLEGTHELEPVDGSTEDNPKFTVAITNGRLTWADGTAATRDAYYTREWTQTKNQNDVWHATGSAFGTNRNGKNYTMQVTTRLTYKQICQVTHTKFLPAAGVESLTIGDKAMIIDFGSGSCDQEVTITINSKSTVVDLSKSL